MAVYFRYASEKLDAAVRLLMLPNPEEATSIVAAWHEIERALKPDDDLGDHEANRQRERVFEIMSTKGIEDPTGEGLWLARARQLTRDEKHAFSRAVWDLESYCRVAGELEG